MISDYKYVSLSIIAVTIAIAYVMTTRTSHQTFVRSIDQNKELNITFSGTRSKVEADGNSARDLLLANINQVNDCVDLSLGDMDLDKATLRSFRGMPLRTLEIWHCRMEPEARELVASFTEIRSLDIVAPYTKAIRSEKVMVSDQGRQKMEWNDHDLERLSSLSQLHDLHIANHRNLSGVGFQSFDHASPLEKLNLHGCRITDDGLKEITRFQNLRSVHLKDSLVTMDGVLELAKMPALLTPPMEEGWKNDELGILEFSLTYNEIYARHHPGASIIPCKYFRHISKEKLQGLLNKSRIFESVNSRTGVGVRRNDSGEFCSDNTWSFSSCCFEDRRFIESLPRSKVILGLSVKSTQDEQ